MDISLKLKHNRNDLQPMKINKNFLLIAVSGILLSSCEQKYQSTNNSTDQKNISVEAIEETIENVKDDQKAVNDSKDKTNQKVTKKMTDRKEYQPLSDEELRKTLTPLQYQVTKHEATERPWTNKFDKHFEEGIYVCIISGEPLFSSKDKYDSGCGWPAFTKPINSNEIVSKTDFKIGYARTEVRAKTGDSHLGHVFEDGPASKGGLRYCINSASLRFIPKTKLADEGYGEYASLFEGGSESN